jgi:dTMP kinase
MKPNAPFITFEGIEGAGKTTLSRWLADWLSAQNIPTRLTCEPGGSELGNALRQLLLHNPTDPLTELFLFLADRSHHVRTVILPALTQGIWVISDRYTDSTLAYQGYGRGLDIETLRHLNALATDHLNPDLTFLIDMPVEQALARTTQPNRFEQEALAFHQRVRDGYLQLAESEPHRFVILNGNQPLESLQQQIQHALHAKGFLLYSPTDCSPHEQGVGIESPLTPTLSPLAKGGEGEGSGGIQHQQSPPEKDAGSGVLESPLTHAEGIESPLTPTLSPLAKGGEGEGSGGIHKMDSQT